MELDCKIEWHPTIGYFVTENVLVKWMTTHNVPESERTELRNVFAYELNQLWELLQYTQIHPKFVPESGLGVQNPDLLDSFGFDFTEQRMTSYCYPLEYLKFKSRLPEAMLAEINEYLPDEQAVQQILARDGLAAQQLRRIYFALNIGVVKLMLDRWIELDPDFQELLQARNLTSHFASGGYTAQLEGLSGCDQSEITLVMKLVHEYTGVIRTYEIICCGNTATYAPASLRSTRMILRIPDNRLILKPSKERADLLDESCMNRFAGHVVERVIDDLTNYLTTEYDDTVEKFSIKGFNNFRVQRFMAGESDQGMLPFFDRYVWRTAIRYYCGMDYAVVNFLLMEEARFYIETSMLDTVGPMNTIEDEQNFLATLAGNLPDSYKESYFMRGNPDARQAWFDRNPMRLLRHYLERMQNFIRVTVHDLVRDTPRFREYRLILELENLHSQWNDGMIFHWMILGALYDAVGNTPVSGNSSVSQTVLQYFGDANVDYRQRTTFLTEIMEAPMIHIEDAPWFIGMLRGLGSDSGQRFDLYRQKHHKPAMRDLMRSWIENFLWHTYSRRSEFETERYLAYREYCKPCLQGQITVDAGAPGYKLQGLELLGQYRPLMQEISGVILTQM